jgi:transporter family protein
MSWLLYAIIGVVLAGASPVLAKSGLRKSNGNLAAAIRGTVLFIGAWVLVRITGQNQSLAGLGQTTLLYLLFSGIVTGVVWICLIQALKTGEVIRVVPVVEASIILDILVGLIFCKDTLTWNKIIILVILIVGLIMIVTRTKGKGRKRAWLLYALAALALISVTVVFDRIGISGVGSGFERLIRYGIALILVWIVTFATGGYKGLRAISFLDGLYLCLSGAVMAGAWYCLHIAYAYGTDTPVAMIERFDMVAAVVLGCVFMRERLSVRAIFGLVFMMAGFLLLLMNLPVIAV